jgi:energy-coupling factor transport system permease protein
VNARAVAAWSLACLVIALATTNPAYRGLVLLAALVVVVAGAGLRRSRRLLQAAAVAALLATGFNFLLSHLGSDVLFTVPAAVPALGGPYTVEAVAFGLVTGVTLAAAILAVAPLSLLLEPDQVVDALPGFLARTGSAVAAALTLVPNLATSFTAVAEAQRLRGWRPRGPRSWTEVVMPVVLTTIEDSLQLAESMEARGFGSGPRTYLRPPRMAAGDWLVVAAAAAAVAGFLLSRLAGWAADWYAYPSLQPPTVAPLPVLACLLLALPALTWPSRRSRN